ncbi:Hypothetical predicted protein [Octopus vulgaris]|uniref:Uncharacterized protein n=1 Tax=Octopus vulgaris TaxID=6645 RepID=A0AA36AKW1_OCTVU|nr:Hypothetical predicted protein [Octopus vulgaris]
MKFSRNFKKILDVQVKNNNDQRHPNTQRSAIASPDFDINNQKDQRAPNNDRPITDEKKIKQEAKKACMNDIEHNSRDITTVQLKSDNPIFLLA